MCLSKYKRSCARANTNFFFERITADLLDSATIDIDVVSYNMTVDEFGRRSGINTEMRHICPMNLVGFSGVMNCMTYYD